ncbi:hypothetical protein [Teredinibacter waterburyi]|uniref:hypothetical protein n=1 Tax=Teredinibacter waterburyi TaxID=1500538 RepID=UPI00165FC789|nr:hypothetical protein [Teredinibacter waterburyi]
MKTIKRKQLIALHERESCPELLRICFLNALANTWSWAPKAPNIFPSSLKTAWDKLWRPPSRETIEPIVKALKATGSNKILDLCSGMGGPIPDNLSAIEEAFGSKVTLVLSDYHPNPSGWETLKAQYPKNHIQYISQRVDARDVESQTGLRTMCCSFHHFRPHDAVGIIQSTVNANEGILIFELTERTPLGFVMVFLTIMASLIDPFVEPRKWSRFIVTYLIPIAPFVYLFDAMTGVFRSYTTREKKILISQVDGHEHYHWEHHKKILWRSGGGFTYVLGYPKQNNTKQREIR